jgi:HEAT repeat protein
MTNKQSQLQNRGFITEGIQSEFESVSFENKIELLKSKIATERTLGARLLKENKTRKTVDHLINALKSEKKLYTKIEICNTLSELEEIAINPLIKCLGKIGNNQHKRVPEKEFLKDSYPLPRDIASRTLIRIGIKAIPELLPVLKINDLNILSELIDAIGHINFNAKTDNIYEPLKTCYNQNKKEDLITWKIIRAFSGIHESEAFLKQLHIEIKDHRLKKEIERSLRLIESRKLNNSKELS